MEKEDKIYYKFLNFFDGGHDSNAIADFDTFQMGVTFLNYESEDDTLNVHLRRPGLLIGKGGIQFANLQAYLGCKVRVHEVPNLWDNIGLIRYCMPCG